MTTMATTPAHAPAHGGHEDENYNRMGINRAGLWLFFLSDAFLFGGLFATRFYISGTERPEELNQALGLIITVILLLSSVTAYLTEVAIARGNRAAFIWNLSLTIALGLIFVAGVGYEWSSAEFGPEEKFGTAFFAMTGLHATHVITGLGALIVLFYLGLKGHFSRESHWGVEATIKYWHFVDVAWVFFYPALYLVSR